MSYTIEITVDDENKISVSVESGAYEAMEEDGVQKAIAGQASGQPMAEQEESGEPSGEYPAEGDVAPEKSESTPVPNIKEALALVLDIYRNGGQVSDVVAASDNSSFDEGFGKPPAKQKGM